jgi:Lon-like ATP-dependent protease
VKKLFNKLKDFLIKKPEIKPLNEDKNISFFIEFKKEEKPEDKEEEKLQTWEELLKIKTTEEVKIPKRLIDRIIGQEKAVEIIKKAALQRRHVLLIGEPGTGKSMLAKALAELLPSTNLSDILVFPNPEDENNPKIKEVPACQGQKIINQYKLKAVKPVQVSNSNFLVILILLFLFSSMPFFLRPYIGDIMAAAMLISSTFIIFLLLLSFSLINRFQVPQFKVLIPKLLINNCGKTKAPFVDATGAHEGALLGDVLHDPLQSGGLGTPPHERVVPGAIHKAHKGVLFIDEIATLSIEMQQELLTAMQEKKMPITGRSERSSGAMVRTDPVPCDFILVAAGNLDALQKMHPALRSRIRGYGYEVFMEDEMDDTPENRAKLVRFVAQEVVQDGKIPHFTMEAVQEIINEARRRAKRGKLTLKLRELAGIVRAAGDIAVEKGHKYVEREDVLEALKIAKTVEEQIADKMIKLKKEYQVIKTTGYEIGRVNGLAVIGETAGIVLPVEAEVTPTTSEPKIVATGKLGEIAKEAIHNVSAVIKKKFGKDLKNYDIYIQFLQTYEGVEGDSASITVATAVVSALLNKPVRQDIAMTGSLSIRGEVLPVGGINQKIRAAYEAGIKEVIIPKLNEKDINLEKEILENMKIHKVENIEEVWKIALKDF